MAGFRKELEARQSDIKCARVELERLYAMRVDDDKIDEPDSAQYKEETMKALRSADSVFTSLAGSIRSIKSVLEALLCSLTWMAVYFSSIATQFSHANANTVAVGSV